MHTQTLLFGIGIEKDSRRPYFIFVYLAYYGFSEGYYWCGFCIFFGIGNKQDINNGLSLFCYLQNKCWNCIYYNLGLLFSDRPLLLWEMYQILLSPSISLELFQLFSDEKKISFSTLREFSNSSQSE
jgi:hypothetical protein